MRLWARHLLGRAGADRASPPVANLPHTLTIARALIREGVLVLTSGCADNARIIHFFAMPAHQESVPLPMMPFIASGPEFANEKTAGQMLAVLAHGVSVAVGATPNLPILSDQEDASKAEDGVVEPTEFFSGEGLRSLVGPRLIVEPDPPRAAEKILAEIDAKRAALGWDA